MPSQRDHAKRALVTLLITLALTYNVHVKINRDAADDLVTKACRKVILKVHPDRGGCLGDAKRLNAARDEWESHRTKNHKGDNTSTKPGVSASAYEAKVL